MNIEKFCETYNFGKVKSILKLYGGLMHKMFKVETDKGTYCIKILNPEVMSRKEAYNNFVISESVSNLAKKNGIPVSSALDIQGDYLKELDGHYYMIFEFVNGKTLNDNEITIEHCKKIGKILANIHSLNYEEIGLKPNNREYKEIYDWEKYIDNSNFNKMSYKDLYLENYKKYNSILKRANERLNNVNINQTLCHLDMDPKNVMWDGNNPIIIDWECALVSNPEIELLEDALCWSGFLSNNFDKNKFTSVFEEYQKHRNIQEIEWFDVICGNLVGRFKWFKYNIERSLGIITDDLEEMKLAEKEVLKTIDEINRYLELIGTMYDLINEITMPKDKDYSNIIKQIVDNNEILKGKEYKLITAGFTNTIYLVDNYVIRICTDINNEERFKNEIDFYMQNKDNDKIPKLYAFDTSKKIVPYFYEIIEKVNGKTLYELWYKLSDIERRKIVIQMINILKSFHLKEKEEFNFMEMLKSKLLSLKTECNLDDDLYNCLLKMIEMFFKKNKFGLIHGDLHFDNLIFDGTKLSLLDFERCMVAPIDYEFRIFSICSHTPWLWASAETDMLTVESDYQELIPMILENYDELREIPYINERLEFYSIMELLNNYKNTKDQEKLDKVLTKVNRLTK